MNKKVSNDKTSKFVKKCLNLFHIKLSAKLENLFIQIFKFAIVGGSAFLIDYGVFTLLSQVFQIHYLIASGLSFSISVIYNYILSIKWVFDVTKKQTTKDFIVFIILSIGGLILNSIIMYIAVDLMHIHELIAKIIATAIVMVYNFITRKIFVEK